MGLLSPLADLRRGLHSYVRGVDWLRQHPRYLALLFAPIAAGLCFIVFGMAVFLAHVDTVVGWVLFAKPSSASGALIYAVCKVFAEAAIFVAMLLMSQLVVSVVAAPLYEVVSTAVERELTGVGPPTLTIRQHFRVVFVELKKVLLILFGSILVLFIPGLNVVSPLIAAFLVGWDFFDYPLSRRGWSLRRRLHLVGANFFAVLGLGLWLVIPFVQIVMMPLAVAGGTILNIEALQRHNLPARRARTKEIR